MSEHLLAQHPWSVPWLQSAPGQRALPARSGASSGAFSKAAQRGTSVPCAGRCWWDQVLTRWNGAEGEAGLGIC